MRLINKPNRNKRCDCHVQADPATGVLRGYTKCRRAGWSAGENHHLTAADQAGELHLLSGGETLTRGQRMALKISFMAVVKENGQRFVYFFDDDTTDAQLMEIWQQQLLDPDLDFDITTYRALCKRLRRHRKQQTNGTLPYCKTQQDLDSKLDTAFEDKDVEEGEDTCGK